MVSCRRGQNLVHEPQAPANGVTSFFEVQVVTHEEAEQLAICPILMPRLKAYENCNATRSIWLRGVCGECQGGVKGKSS